MNEDLKRALRAAMADAPKRKAKAAPKPKVGDGRWTTIVGAGAPASVAAPREPDPELTPRGFYADSVVTGRPTADTPNGTWNGQKHRPSSSPLPANRPTIVWGPHNRHRFIVGCDEHNLTVRQIVDLLKDPYGLTEEQAFEAILAAAHKGRHTVMT